MENEEYLSFRLDEKGNWRLGFHIIRRDGYCPPEKPDPQTLKYKEGDSVWVIKNGKRIKCKVENTDIFINITKNEKNWKIYYCLRWEGVGHTAGYFLEEQIEKDN